jgi:GT2 family glycosyltransferase
MPLPDMENCLSVYKNRQPSRLSADCELAMDLTASTPARAPQGKWSVTVIIPAFNEENVLAACLQSILDQRSTARGAIEEIVVADNCSTDSTCAIARSFGARIVTVSPGYPGRARNAGARAAQGDILAFVDADCVLPVNWLGSCLEQLADNQTVAAAVPLAAPGEHAAWVPRAWFQLTRPPDKLTRVPWLPAFNLVVCRESFFQVGGFDETLRTCEDSDLSFRLSKCGGLVLDGRTSAHHLGESGTLYQFLRREMWRGAGNLASALKRGSVVSELASIMVPPLFLFMLLIGLILTVCGFVLPLALSIGILAIATALALPLAVVARKRIYPWRQPIRFVQCWLLVSTYLIARTLGMLIPSRRVGRGAVVQQNNLSAS